MSANSASNLKSRLRVVPFDVWSTREKLCLASSVLKSGDQNWSSVSRPLRSFGEPNRPTDWFHQKYCAIQYQDLLEKIETETPKRKRSERGEETPQTIIVRNLTKQRIEELREITEKERQLISKIKHDLDLIQNKQMTEKRFQEITNDIKEKEIKDKEKELEYKKLLEEREVKVALMNRKSRQKPIPISIPTTPTPTQPVAANTTGSEVLVNSPLNEPLKVEVESDANTTQTTNISSENKLSLTLTSPSTSPLLTSLLQSPTPSTPNLLSPNKSGLSANTFSRQKPLSQASSPITSIARRPSIHSTPEKTPEVKSTNDSAVSTTNTRLMSSGMSPEKQTEQKLSADSSKLSKLLESPNTTNPKITTIIETKSIETKAKESEQTIQKSDQTKNLNETGEEIKIIESKTKANDSKKETEKREDLHKKAETSERLLRNSDKTEESISDKKSNERTNDGKDIEKSADKRTEESVEKISIKQEIMETNAEEVEQTKESDNLNIKEEPMDSTAEDSNQRTPSTRANKRLRKTPNTINITPTAMRRSRRVAQKDTKSATDDSTEVSDQSAANTPQAVKPKRGSVDDTTETSMSEESMDAKIVVPSVANSETMPNSPASVRNEDMDNSKEYRTWKKAVMVNWRVISSHKNASLFSHPVTETEAKGYEDIVHRPMDLNSIKKRIETGMVRTTAEYQRDILLMFQNAIMFNNSDHDVHKMAVDMQKDTIATIEEFIETRKHDNQSNESKLRARDRRSNVSTASPLVTDTEISGRRKSRGASTDTDSNASSLNKSIVIKKKKT